MDTLNASSAVDVPGEYQVRHKSTKILTSPSENLVLEVMDPNDPERYNNETRFSPVAYILRAVYKGRDYLYTPEVKDNRFGQGCGIPQEFDIGERTNPPGYDEAAPGEPFLKVGVGILERLNHSPYFFSARYPVIESAKTDVEWSKGEARFVQTLDGDAKGYCCRFEEVITVENSQVILSYTLTNTGDKAFKTEQYLHNFTRLGENDVDSSYHVTFPYSFELCDKMMADVKEMPVPMARTAAALVFSDAPSGPGKVFVKAPIDYEGENALSVLHLASGMKLTIGASVPCNTTSVFFSEEQVSPEMNLEFSLQPGETVKFNRKYTFEG